MIPAIPKSTGHKDAGGALPMSEELFRAIAAGSPDHILVQDRDLRYVLVINPQLGLTEADMLGKTDYDILKKEDADRITAIKRGVLETGKPATIETPVINLKGEAEFFEGTYVPKFGADGTDEGIIGYFHNITGKKKTEEALRESEKRYRNLFDKMDEGFCIVQVLFDAQDRPLDYCFLEVNAAFERQTGLHGAEGKSMRELAPAHEAYWFEMYGKIALTGEPARFMNEARALNRWYDVYAYRIGRPEDRQVAILFNDISRYKLAEQAFADANAQKARADYTRNLIEASLDPLVTISAEGTITDANEAATNATGAPKRELIGTDFSGYFTEPDKADLGYRQVFDRGSVTDYPLTIRHKNGTLMHVLYNAAVYKDEDGRVQGVFAAARDVTERKRIETELDAHRHRLEELVEERTAELEDANDELRLSRRAALNLLKDATEARRNAEQAGEAVRRSAEDLARSNKDLEQFAYVASHDLQEPLRAVGGFMGLLKTQYTGKLDATAQEYIGHAVEGAERMQNLIQDLLTFSRVGTRGAIFKTVAMKDALDGALKNLQAVIAETDVKITFDTLPAVSADPSQMLQLLQNLVGNAVKFHGTRRPEVHIGAQRRDYGWEFAVKDNGIGIEPQYFDRIFLIFQRLHTRTQYKGTGIGLAVCKKIVERHGGKIWVDSRSGEGSTFHFTIPDAGETV
jgi:PAS domain S-box-containing protein